MSEHTKGPWLLDGRTIYALEHHGWRKGEETFRNRFSANVQGYGLVPDEELEANASLMAAAPELLEALEALRSFMWSEGYADQSVPMALADAAIRSATHTAIGNSENAEKVS